MSARTSLYGYEPSIAPSAAYLAVYAVGTVLHTGLAVKYKYWIAFATLVPGGILEVLGWAGRYWSHSSPLNFNPFIMQTCW